MEQTQDTMVGRRIKSLRPDMDCDEYDQEDFIGHFSCEEEASGLSTQSVIAFWGGTRPHQQ